MWDGHVLSPLVEVRGAAVTSGSADSEGSQPAFDFAELVPVAFDVFHARFVEFEVGSAQT